MARLTAKGRAKIPSAQFAGPGRTYPVEDKAHDRAAIVDASRNRNRGILGSGTASRIIARAKRKLGK